MVFVLLSYKTIDEREETWSWFTRLKYILHQICGRFRHWKLDEMLEYVIVVPVSYVENLVLVGLQVLAFTTSWKVRMAKHDKKEMLF